MARRDLFRSAGTHVPAATTTNAAGGLAYSTTDRTALAMLAVTGTFNDTFYTRGADQLQQMLALAAKCDPEWVAKVAVYARQHGLMKDAPVLLLTYLFGLKTNSGRAAFNSAFPHVCNNVGQIKNFVQMVRSGITGRKSLGTMGKRAIANVLNAMEPSQIFWQAYGSDPSFADVLKLARVRPASTQHDALFGYFLGKAYVPEHLPANVRSFERFKSGFDTEVPSVPFVRLTSLNMTTDQWSQVARIMSWNQLRMNLNKLGREGVFSSQEMVRYVADKLRNEQAIRRSSALPFAVYNTYRNLDSTLPATIRNAVADAVELAAAKAPVLPGETLVLVDSSGSMSSPATGRRRSASSTLSCNDVASFFAASLLKANPDHVTVVGYDTKVHTLHYNARDSVTSLAAAIGLAGGGTDTGSGIRWALHQGAMWDNIVIVSDNESWMNARRWNSNGNQHYSMFFSTQTEKLPYNDGTSAAQAWTSYRRKRRGAKMYCIDIQPNTTVQAPDDHSVLNVSGLTDAVFKVISFAADRQQTWEQAIDNLEL